MSEQVKPASEQKAGSNEWIKWEGGDCPVPFGSCVDVEHRDGEIYTSVVIGEDVECSNWSINPFFHEDGDIVSYRIVKPQTDYRAQRDALLKCLALIEPKLDFSGWENGQGEDIGNEINAAIASVKGGA